ncbi:DUF3667 domain-containing protein [Chitinophaga nivalis]|uniref:DUF3667 domain-containing protein n=1 Tax=Chitinophaga nivalis TaxID=2991709 RepID=A0ABT3IQ27_9BACT|nr:DUF3667 domain-containing protein [Chitinophaga nivalis]MCW3464248.1 DUF3667 domain-containing protein [Chitinophaga nivalis]MCW3486061.1 DUF3667 domain-containing protein [Chitinophaga nivalis]
MKTQALRIDQNCLNCGTTVPERFCTHCGQENTVQHESFGHLCKHFVADIFHYDSQFLITFKYLLLRPGFLTKEYLAGKRVRYVNPIKLYVFVSFVFFLGFFALNSPHGKKKEHHDNALLTINVGDTAAVAPKKDDSRTWKGFKNVEEYDHYQESLPVAKQDGFLQQRISRRMVELREEHGDAFQQVLVESFLHNIPKMMFLILPLAAWFMKLVYSRKRWVYGDHAIFALHTHAFAFILLLIGNGLTHYLHSEFYTQMACLLIFAYIVAGLKNTYQQSLRASFFKGALLVTLYGLTTMVVFMLFIVLIFGLFL